MVVGIDACMFILHFLLYLVWKSIIVAFFIVDHDLKRQRESVTAMVASTDDSFTHWHSRCNFQSPKSEVGASLKVSFTSALTAYAKVQ